LNLTGQTVDSHLGRRIGPTFDEALINNGGRGQDNSPTAAGLPVRQDARQYFGCWVDVHLQLLLQFFVEPVGTDSVVGSKATIQKQGTAQLLGMVTSCGDHRVNKLRVIQ